MIDFYGRPEAVMMPDNYFRPPRLLRSRSQTGSTLTFLPSLPFYAIFQTLSLYHAVPSRSQTGGGKRDELYRVGNNWLGKNPQVLR